MNSSSLMVGKKVIILFRRGKDPKIFEKPSHTIEGIVKETSSAGIILSVNLYGGKIRSIFFPWDLVGSIEIHEHSFK